MLKPELARAQLAKLKSSKNAEARLDRLRKLPKPTARAAFALFCRNEDGDYPRDWDERRKLPTPAMLAITNGAKLRARILSALFPTFAKPIEAGWQLLARLPYTTGYNRRGFRQTDRPELYVDRRQSYLEGLLHCLDELPDDVLTVEWVAAWAVHLGWNTQQLGYLLAAAVDSGGAMGEAVFTILKDTAANRHEIGGPGGHATRGLLCCARPDAWEFTEQLLLAAQRQEGLRQTVLEAVDEAHPQAFGRMLRVVLDQNLIRFASVARAAGVWLGEVQMVENPTKLKADLQLVLEFLDDPAARRTAIAKGDAARAYRALWSIAFEDAAAAVTAATPLIKDKDPARRFAAAKLASETGLPDVVHLLMPLLNDASLPLVGLAVHYAGLLSADTAPADLFERLEKIIPKLPETAKELVAPVEGWFVPNLGQDTVANILVGCLGKRPAEKLLPYLPLMYKYQRVQALAKLCEPRTLTTKVRKTLLAIAGEPNRFVREAAIKHLKNLKLAEDEAQTLEGYLTRKQPDFRRSVFELLLGRNDRLVNATIDRLLATGDANSRAAGIELARRMIDDERDAELIREKLRDYREAKGKRLTESEAQAIEIALDPSLKPPTLDDGLGTFDPDERSAVVEPVDREVTFATPASAAFLKELDEFIHEHRDRTFVNLRNTGRTQEVVLGSIEWYWQFPEPDDSKPIAEDRAFLPLAELWHGWWESRSDATRDADGFELLRAIVMPRMQVREGEEDEPVEIDRSKESPDFAAVRKRILSQSVVAVRYEPVIRSLLQWFERLYAPPGAADFVLDAAESALAIMPEECFEALPRTERDAEDVAQENDDSVEEWRQGSIFVTWLDHAKRMKRAADWTGEHSSRLYSLLRWLDEPRPGVRRLRPELDPLLAAYAAGGATVADFADHLIGPRAREQYGREGFDSLRVLTNVTVKESRKIDPFPELRAIVERVVARIVEIELARGESPTAATTPAGSVNRLVGLDTLFDLIAALGKNGYVKPPSYGPTENKPAILTRLVQVCEPKPDEMPEVFAAAAMAAIKSGRFELERIVELGLVNPRWVAQCTATVRWPGYEEAVYWFMAHTNNAWQHALGDEEAHSDGEKPQSKWLTILKSRTDLSAEQRADGLIDVAWFHRAYKALGSDKKWDAIEAAAKFLGYGQAHKKAARLADVLLGRTKKKDLVHEIRTKTLKESVRLLGLLPLPTDLAKRDAELADRYKVLKEYERYARGLSSLSKEPAMQAVRLGMENLAVTAGLADPVRLEWAVTAREVADLAKGPATVTVKSVAVSLALNALAEPEIAQTKDGKPLKSLPPDAKKNAKVAELFERKKSLSRMASNTRRSLEGAMCAGDRFRGAELVALMDHALVRPLLERLVLKTPAGMGYPANGGKALVNWAGKKTPVKAADGWIVAHPLDFVDAGDWHEWQAECFRAERLQPFKQVFRELYVISEAEREDGDRSRRYSGQQVNENQAKALLASRGWSTREEIGKLYRDANLVVDLVMDHGYSTPSDAAAPAVGHVEFHRRDDWKRLPLSEVPGRIFSEVMRDLDLVVSVAHVGGVDPEASQSTVEMRADLVRETCRLLKLDNVTLESRHVLIRGEYGRYSVHLGSGGVHKQPGGSLCVVAVPAGHRGRLFLPFADDDPRTAEIVSKVLLLARDREIQDPTILQQIAGR